MSKTATKTDNLFIQNSIKWSNILKQFVGFLSVFGHFVGLALKGLRKLKV